MSGRRESAFGRRLIRWGAKHADVNVGDKLIEVMVVELKHEK
jgi:hypothetical protein